MYGFRVYQSLFKNLDFNLGYFYTTSDAKGYDELNETKVNSDDSDATNYEHAYFAGLDYVLPKVFSGTMILVSMFNILELFIQQTNTLKWILSTPDVSITIIESMLIII
ncbi:MAG: hypothetical protein U5J96_14695 [Ignavibacteriaceae bacterium]|nr:hypothetical protein [Ignavibacteriaceae bacterium]